MKTICESWKGRGLADIKVYFDRVISILAEYICPPFKWLPLLFPSVDISDGNFLF